VRVLLVGGLGLLFFAVFGCWFFFYWVVGGGGGGVGETGSQLEAMLSKFGR